MKKFVFRTDEYEVEDFDTHYVVNFFDLKKNTFPGTWPFKANDAIVVTDTHGVVLVQFPSVEKNIYIIQGSLSPEFEAKMIFPGKNIINIKNDDSYVLKNNIDHFVHWIQLINPNDEYE